MRTARGWKMGALALAFVACSSGSSSSTGADAGSDAVKAADTGPRHDAGMACSAPDTSCGGACVALSSDPANCGTCGKACGAGLVCSQGACALSCAGGSSKCGASCVDEQSDPKNCGACGNACAVGQVCSSGQCASVCGAGQATCGVDAGAPYCADEESDNGNCGGCGVVCPAGQGCSRGACVAVCSPGEQVCSGGDGGASYCANEKTDNSNCGGCGRACGAGQVCSSGMCGVSCTGLTTLCAPDGGTAYCAAEPSDNKNCGGCGVVCGAEQVCSASQCASSCTTGQTLCTPMGAAAYCADELSDNANCGACGTGCSGGQQCTTGMCACPTTAPTTCGMGGAAACTNVQTDTQNCGVCGTQCGAGELCTSGTCVSTCGPNESCTAQLCASVPEGSPATLTCPAGTTIYSVDFASFGTPTGTCGAYATSPGCNATDSIELVRNACIGKSTCTIDATDGEFTDPCPGTPKALDLQVTCSTSSGARLIGHWAMNDSATATFAADSSGYSIPAMVVGGGMTFAPGQGLEGQSDGALLLDGSSYLMATYPNDSAGDGSGVYMPQGNTTYAMWFKTTTAVVGGLQVLTGGGCDRVIGNGDSDVVEYNAWEEVNGTGSVVVNDGNWHQAVYVLDEAVGLSLYIDGALDNSTNAPTDNCGVGCSGFAQASQYNIGTGADCRFDAGNFVGYIDDVRIYDGVLSATDVAALYAATMPVTTVQILVDCDPGSSILNTFTTTPGTTCYTPINPGGASWVHFLSGFSATLWENPDCTGCSTTVTSDLDFCASAFTTCPGVGMNDNVQAVSFP